jgi:Flp pilus assembly protein protease CpaA
MEGAAMSQYMCDICSKTLDRGEITFHIATTIHRAIRDGLNPWKTPGINMSVSAGLGAAFGLGSDEQYAHWRQRALADTTDWGLCPACTQAVGRVSGPPSAPAPAKSAPRRDYASAFDAALTSTSPRVDAAVAKFEAEIASDPDSAEKRFWLGAAYLTAAGAEKNMTFLDRAIESFQRALQMDPRHKNSYAKLLGAYISKGDDERVRETAMRWARVDPDLPPDARRWLREQEATGRGESSTASEVLRRPTEKSIPRRPWQITAVVWTVTVCAMVIATLVMVDPRALAIITVLFFLLGLITDIEIRKRIIPDRMTLSGIILGLILRLLVERGAIFDVVAGAIVPGGILFAVILVSRGGLGGGVMKLGAMIGAFLGWQRGSLAILIAVIVSGVCATTLMAGGKLRRTDAWEFGPFLAAGGIVAALWGELMLRSYFR